MRLEYFRYIGQCGVLSEKAGRRGEGGRYESRGVMAAISRSALCQLVVASQWQSIDNAEIATIRDTLVSNRGVV